MNQTTTATTNSTSKKGKSGKFLLVALLVLLVLGLASACWYLWEQDKAIGVLFDQQNEINAQRNSSDVAVRSLESLIETIQLTLEENQSQFIQQELELQQLRDQLVNIQFRANENITESAWENSSIYLLNEVEGMLRLGQQRLLLANDVPTVIALLVSSDEILRDMNDSAVYSVRDGIASDLASLRSVPDQDIQGLFVRVSALSQRVSALQLKNGTEEQLSNGETIENEDGFFSRFSSELSRFVTIKKLDAPLQPLLTAEQGYYIKQNIRLLLEQIQLALWRNQQVIYRNSIAQAIELTEQYFISDDESEGFVSGLESLAEENINPTIPAANRGLNSVRQILDAYERSQLIQSEG